MGEALRHRPINLHTASIDNVAHKSVQSINRRG